MQQMAGQTPAMAVPIRPAFHHSADTVSAFMMQQSESIMRPDCSKLTIIAILTSLQVHHQDLWTVD